MSKYNNSKIYKIVCNETGLCYFGSTIEKYLSNRMAKHRSCYRKFLNDKKQNITSFKVLEKNNYKISLVETVCCDNVYELRNRERFYIENYPCVNKQIPNQTQAEYMKVYRQTEKGKEIQKQCMKRYNKKKNALK